MESKHKTRLIGILVLAAVAVVLYQLMTSSGGGDEALSLNVPEPPSASDIPAYIDLVNVPLEVPVEPGPETIEPVLVSVEEALLLETEPAFDLTEESEAVATASETMGEAPSLDQNDLPVSWTLQLAALSRFEGAQTLLNKLQNNGFQAYVREGSDSNGKPLYRVYVGPDLQKEDLLAVRSIIERDYQLKGVVKRFHP